MTDQHDSVVPLWTLSTADGPDGASDLPAVFDGGALTPERLGELRSALAAFSAAPLATLEAYPLVKRQQHSAGLPLDAASPLAHELSRLIAASAKDVPAVAEVAASTEVLYRMVVPAKFAAQVSRGVVKSMKAKAGQNAILGALVDPASVVVAQARFVPVEAAAAGAASVGAVGTAVGAAAAGSALTVAAPLVLLAVAAGASAYAEQQRQEAIERITEMLEKMQQDRLEQERNELDGCRDAIDKATALLLDRGKVGASLGLDAAVFTISKAVQAADHRVAKWEAALHDIADDRVEVDSLEADFPGITEDGGEFRTHAEIAALAVALRRRVVILQAVEAGQSDPGNPFENFVQSLNADLKHIDELERRIRSVLLRLSALELRPPKQLVRSVMTRNQVEDLLEASYQLRALQDDVRVVDPAADVVIEIEKHQDGTLLVLPARTS